MRILYRSKTARKVFIVKMDKDITAKLKQKEKPKIKHAACDIGLQRKILKRHVEFNLTETDDSNDNEKSSTELLGLLSEMSNVKQLTILKTI